MVDNAQWIEYHVAEHEQQVMWGTHDLQMNIEVPVENVIPVSNNNKQLSVKASTMEERNTRRKQATQREKRRMEKLNHCIEDIRAMVCPNMKTPTKAKILREAINRIQYLEKITAELMQNQPVEHKKLEQPEPVIVGQTYSPEIPKNYSPEPTEGNYSPGGMASPNNSFGREGAPLPHVEMLQMSDESNSAGFDNEFYLSVAPDHLAYNDQTFDGHYQYGYM